MSGKSTVKGKPSRRANRIGSWILAIFDNRIDTITINGSAIADKFIIGNQILNRGNEQTEEIQYDVLQITHTKEGSAEGDNIIIVLRSLTLNEDTAINDIVTIDGGAGNDTLPGVVPNRPDVISADDVAWPCCQGT